MKEHKFAPAAEPQTYYPDYYPHHEKPESYASTAAEKEYQHFEKVFSHRGLPDEMQKFRLDGLSAGGEKDVWIIKLLLLTQMVSSRTEAERLVRQGAVTFDGKKIKEVRKNVTVRDGVVLRVGRRKFRKIASEN